MIIFKKNGRLSKRGFEVALEIFKGLNDCKEYKVKTCVSTYSHVYSEPHDHSADYEEVCDHFKLEYIKGNEAPRGGREGNYMIIKKDLRKPFFKNMEELLAQPPKEKTTIVLPANMNEYISEFNKIDISMIKEFVKNFNETKDMIILRKKYGLNFSTARDVAKTILKM